MNKQEKMELMIAYEAVFDGLDETRLCRKDVCKNLIKIMQKYTSVDIGDVNTGVMKTKELQDEYYELIKK